MMVRPSWCSTSAPSMFWDTSQSPMPMPKKNSATAVPGTDSASSASATPTPASGGDKAGGPHGIGRPDPAHHVAGGGQCDQGTRRHAQQQGSHLPGGDVQDVRHRGDAGGPAGEHEPVDPENQERRRGGGIELRAGCRLGHTITTSTECWVSWASSSVLSCLSVTRTSTASRDATSATALAFHLAAGAGDDHPARGFQSGAFHGRIVEVVGQQPVPEVQRAGREQRPCQTAANGCWIPSWARGRTVPRGSGFRRAAAVRDAGRRPGRRRSAR